MKAGAQMNPQGGIDVQLPDGDCTVTIETSKGRKVTLRFDAYGKDRHDEFVDIVYHDSGLACAAEADRPVFDVVALGGNEVLFETRNGPKKVGTLCILLETAGKGASTEVTP